MIGPLGQATLVLALLTAGYGVVAALWGARRQAPALLASSKGAVTAVFALVSFAALLMEAALVGHDFSLAYVARNGSLGTPLFYTVISLWGALEGSILLWIWLLAGFTLLAVRLEGPRHPTLLPVVTAVLLGVQAFFLALAAGPATPFTTLAAPPLDGRGPNPLLQNHPLMAIHPPCLYAGYVGWAVPYAFAIAALVAGRTGEPWLATIRRWGLVAWAFLTLGILLGGWWSYEVLGWGGYWAWDPVENASLLPWLTGTAVLHTIMVQERRKMLKGWNLALLITTFALTIFGTFLTRSGILSSVHAFSQSSIGPLFLGFIALIVLASFGLLVARSDRLPAEGDLDALVSRESAFLLNNLLLLGFAFAVFLGTLFPLLSEAVRGVKVSVGEPFFNTVNVPIGLGLVGLMGLGPLLAWRRASWASLQKTVPGPALAAAGAAALAAALGVRPLAPLAAVALAAFAAATGLQTVLRGWRTRRRLTGEGWGRALVALTARHRRRYGGLLVHLGVGLVVVALTASTVFKQEQEVTLAPGQTLTLGRYTLRFDALRDWQEPHRAVVEATVSVFQGPRPLGVMRPAKRFYSGDQQPIGTVDVRSTPREDLYLILTAFPRDGSSATLKVLIRPLVMELWLGGLTMAAGALLALGLPRRRRAAPVAEMAWSPGRS